MMHAPWMAGAIALGLLLGALSQPALASPQAYTIKATTLAVVVEGKTHQLPTTLKTRRQPEGQRYNTDFILDADLRSLYANLPGMIGGVKKSRSGQTITISNVSCRYAQGRIIIQSTADYRQALTNSFDLSQTLHSTVALYPEFKDGILRLNYKVRKAAFEGITQGLLDVTGTDPRTVVKTIFDLYFKEDLTYPLPEEYRHIPIQKKELRLYSRDGKFFGLRAGGSALLSEAQYQTLLKRHF
jgi:hypothetical protein